MTWLEKKMATAERRGEKRGEERGEKRGEERGEKRGEERGEKRGAAHGWQGSITKFWTAHFGPMPKDLTQRLEAEPEPSRLERIFDALLGARDQDEALSKLAEL